MSAMWLSLVSFANATDVGSRADAQEYADRAKAEQAAAEQAAAEQAAFKQAACKAFKGALSGCDEYVASVASASESDTQGNHGVGLIHWGPWR